MRQSPLQLTIISLLEIRLQSLLLLVVRCFCSLVSEKPTGHAASIKTIFLDLELGTFRNNPHAGTLGPVHLTPRYIKERVFPTDCDPRDVRILIDGFSRDAQRWPPFKEFAEPC
jgi:hypothetical protein